MSYSADCMLGEKRLLFTGKGLGLTYARDLTLDLIAKVTESCMESFVIGEVGYYDLASRVRTDALLLPSLTFKRSGVDGGGHGIFANGPFVRGQKMTEYGGMVVSHATSMKLLRMKEDTHTKGLGASLSTDQALDGRLLFPHFPLEYYVLHHKMGSFVNSCQGTGNCRYVFTEDIKKAYRHPYNASKIYNITETPPPVSEGAQSSDALNQTKKRKHTDIVVSRKPAGRPNKRKEMLETQIKKRKKELNELISAQRAEQFKLKRELRKAGNLNRVSVRCWIEATQAGDAGDELFVNYGSQYDKRHLVENAKCQKSHAKLGTKDLTQTRSTIKCNSKKQCCK
jgi:hypothetical protein